MPAEKSSVCTVALVKQLDDSIGIKLKVSEMIRHIGEE